MSKLNSLRLNPKLLLGESVKEELNKLFYLDKKPKEELEMLEYQYSKEEENRMGLHASTVTGAGKKFCYREQVVSLIYADFIKAGKNPPKQINEEFKKIQARDRNIPIHLKRIFEEGNMIGEKWQRLFIRGELGVKEDMDVQRYNEEYQLTYTPDAIINLKGKRYVVEIKSMSTNSFQTCKSHPGGRKQLKMYMYMEGINDGFVLVQDKNNQDFKIFLESDIDESDDDIAKFINIMERIKLLKRRAIKSKKIRKCKPGTCNCCY